MTGIRSASVGGALAALLVAALFAYGSPAGASEGCHLRHYEWESSVEKTRAAVEQNIDGFQRMAAGAKGTAFRLPGYPTGQLADDVIQINFRIDPYRQPHRAGAMSRQSLEAEMAAAREYAARCFRPGSTTTTTAPEEEENGKHARADFIADAGLGLMQVDLVACDGMRGPWSGKVTVLGFFDDPMSFDVAFAFAPDTSITEAEWVLDAGALTDEDEIEFEFTVVFRWNYSVVLDATPGASRLQFVGTLTTLIPEHGVEYSEDASFEGPVRVGADPRCDP